MLTVITPTGERAEAFEYCQRMLMRQTHKGFRWIVVDDGTKPQELWFRRADVDVQVIRPKPHWREGQNTQGRNLLAALERVHPDDGVVTVWEDDDWYAPDWLEWVFSHAGDAALFGEGAAIYYNVATRRLARLANDAHASLRCSAFSGRAIARLRDIIANDLAQPKPPERYYDLVLWKREPSKALFARERTVGIKGMPGRAGICAGHSRLAGGSHDPDLSALRALIGNDADWYTDYYKESGLMAERLIVSKPFHHKGVFYRPGMAFNGESVQEAELLIGAGNLTRKVFRDPAGKKFVPHSQERTLAQTVVEKAAEDDHAQTPESFIDDDASASEDDTAPRRRGRPRKIQTESADDE